MVLPNESQPTSELPIQIKRVQDEDGHRQLEGRIDCPERGPVDLETCTGCANCRGVLLKPSGGQVVLCARGMRRDTIPDDCAGAWLSRPPVAVNSATPARELAGLMLEYDADPFLVVDEHEVSVGLVTLRDVLAASLEGTLDDRVAGQIMRPLPNGLPEDAPMAEATLRIVEERTHAVPLTDPSGCVTSLLTGVDALDWAADRSKR